MSTNSPNYSLLLEQATEIAETAAKIAYSYFRSAVLIEMKENGTPVTIADKKTEQFIRGELARSFPEHTILGEEFGKEVKNSDFTWMVDPIDGTRSFIRGIPTFGTLLALIERGEPVVGIMVLPALEETYIAAKGIGAYCNGSQLRVSPTKTVESAFVSVGDYDCFESAGKTDFLHRIMKESDTCRGYTDCFGHALVLRGSVDAMVDPVVNPWDVAPIACLISEAGGSYCDFLGNKTFEATSFITSNADLSKALLNLS